MLYPAVLFNWRECKGSDLGEIYNVDSGLRKVNVPSMLTIIWEFSST